jgi:hypothetical protein
MTEQGAAPAGKRRTLLLHPGGAGAPPGDTMVPCQELADGMAARLARGSTGLGHPKGASPPSRKARRTVHRKARPGAAKNTGDDAFLNQSWLFEI